MKTLFLVNGGKVRTLVTPTRQLVECLPGWGGADFYSAVYAYADSRQEALKLARKYDKNLIQPDNVTLWTGETVAALK
jgi:hypothetical protein